MSKIYEYFKKLDEENKISQTFLIGNAYFDDISDELYQVLDDFIFKNGKKSKDNVDLYILKKDNINKDEIKDLLKNLATTSQFNNKKVYIIDESEKLSDTVYNAMLKTLEEPPAGVYAILITNNIDCVKSTILSRCQKIFIAQAKEKNESNQDNEVIASKLIENIEKYGIKTIAYNYGVYSQIKDRNKLIDILYEMLFKYKTILKQLINNEKIENELFVNANIENISKKILIIDKNINLLNNYLNKNLSIDRFIISMGRCEL